MLFIIINIVSTGPVILKMTSSDLSMRFVTQDTLDDKRKRRQEEWEKKRRPEDPIGILPSSSVYRHSGKYS